MESSTLVTRADVRQWAKDRERRREERGKFGFGLYLVHGKQSSLPFSFFLACYSLFHTPLPSTMDFSSFFQKRQSSQSSNDIICCLSLWVNGLHAHPKSPSHTQRYWFSQFSTSIVGEHCCSEQFAICLFCGVVCFLSLTSPSKEEKAGHKKLLGYR